MYLGLNKNHFSQDEPPLLPAGIQFSKMTPDQQKKESIVALEYSAKSCKKWQFLMIWYVFKKKSIYKQACYNLFETYLTNAVMYINLPNIIRSKKGIKQTFCFIF